MRYITGRAGIRARDLEVEGLEKPRENQDPIQAADKRR